MNVSTVNLNKGEAEVLNRLYEFYQFYSDNGDLRSATKIKDLISKVIHREKILAFCGHFSAGKSSMINRLIGKEILASSPIPTSANLVKLRISNQSLVKLIYQNGRIRQYPEAVQFEQFKKYFKDGELIRSVEIEIPSDVLPLGAVIMDTPGIDSTDDAHRLATESALHLADTLFYVMDYNHVLAEENFLFTKEMEKFGKDIYLIVNMIDKHREQELPFTSYKKTIEEAFLAWDIHPKKIFYTSLKEPEHPFNELDQLIKEIKQWFLNDEKWQLDSSVKLIMEEHLRKRLAEQDEHRSALEQILAGLSMEERKNLEGKHNELIKEITRKKSACESFQSQFLQAQKEILKNAYLMPAETRELAKQYLEAIQKDFKVGMFFTKKKTEEVRQTRLKAFLGALEKGVDSQIVWHLKDLFMNTMKQHNIKHFELESKIQQFTIQVNMQMIENAVKSGALVTGESVLNFTNDVAENIKKHALTVSQNLLNELESVILQNVESDLSELEKKKEKLAKLLSADKELERLDFEYDKAKKHLQEIFSLEHHDLFEERFREIISIYETADQMEVEEESITEDFVQNQKQSLVEPLEDQNIDPSPFDFYAESQKMLHKLEKTANLLSDIPTMEKIAGQLSERANRLRERQFTVALFGAFSAGKSSFANALIGERILPVSPNPTTAAINRILPANDFHPTKTGVVTLKREEQMLADVNEAFEKFNIEARNLDEAYEKVLKLVEKEELNRSYQTQISFLTAFTKGYPKFKNKWGEKIEVNLDSFQQFVAEEDKSCFVESIDFYFESEVTNQGVTFVDTPGADSINARHTDVAFEYIKNADAIIFVTYYNHAFSKADREFLIQLGRVKDQFALDKMFFIVNAVDLANSDEELQDVLNYINSQLISYGIRNAKIFPVSSMNALKEKQTGENYSSGFKHFEQRFLQFINYDLGKMALTASETEWIHAVERLRFLVETANTDFHKKEEIRKSLIREKNTVEEILSNFKSDFLFKQVEQELRELVYYIYQRCNYRYNDFFKESFNPATIKGSGNEAKLALQQALRELLQAVGFDLAQELRATSLRLEHYFGKILNEVYDQMKKQLEKMNENLSFSLFEPGKIETPIFQNEIKDLSLRHFSKALSGFKNTKTFFEQNEKKMMAEQIQNLLQQHMKDYLAKGEKILTDVYFDSVDKIFNQLYEHIYNETIEQYDAWLSALENKFDTDHLKTRLNEVELLIVDSH